MKLTKTRKFFLLFFPTAIILLMVALGPFISVLIGGGGLGVLYSQVAFRDEIDW